MRSTATVELRETIQAPPEKLAYVASFDPTRKRPDAMAVVDLDPESAGHGQIVGQTDLAIGDELHHFGWNACSSSLCPNAPHPHVERRYLIVPGIRSSRETTPPIRSFPVSFGLNGSETSYW